MSSLTVLIQGNHVVFGNNGKPLSPGHQYAQKDTPLIQQYISDGFVSVVSKEIEESPQTPKKPATSKTLTGQETDPLTAQENSNG